MAVDRFLHPAYLYFAKERRRTGHYDALTRWLFLRAHKLYPSVENLYFKLRFNRDLGFVPQSNALIPLVKQLSELPSSIQRFVVNSLAESASPLLADIPQNILRDLSSNSPAAAYSLNKYPDKNNSAHNPLSRMHSQQLHWKEEFATYISEHRNSICVVGNAPTTRNKNLGAIIDSYDIVIRFNQFAAQEQESEPSFITTCERGRATDVWMISPDLHPPFPNLDTSLSWLLLSGPEANYHVSNWTHLVPHLLNQQKLVSIPLSVWRRLVETLKAPPSAGLLCLSWIIDLLGSPKGVVAAGFEIERNGHQPYHHALYKHRAGSRHNWKGEQVIKKRWREQGLLFLDHSR